MATLDFRRISTKNLKRSTVAALVIILVAAILLCRIFWLQTAGFEKYQGLVINQMTTESTIKANRGKIYDTNGNILATSVTAYRVFISPRTIASAQKELDEAKASGDYSAEIKVDNYAELISRRLSDILDVTYDKVKENTEYTQYLDRTIARNVDEESAEKVRKFISEYKLNDLSLIHI